VKTQPQYPDRIFQWCRSEKELRQMQKRGWFVPEQRITHHHFHAILLEFRGPGEPKLPEGR
jgi:hypothetical protein